MSVQQASTSRCCHWSAWQTHLQACNCDFTLGVSRESTHHFTLMQSSFINATDRCLTSWDFPGAFTPTLCGPDFWTFQFDPNENYRCVKPPPYIVVSLPHRGSKRGSTKMWSNQKWKSLSRSSWTMVRFISSVKAFFLFLLLLFLEGMVRTKYRKFWQAIFV